MWVCLCVYVRVVRESGRREREREMGEERETVWPLRDVQNIWKLVSL